MPEDQVRVFSGTLYNYLTLIFLALLYTVNTIIIANSVGTGLYGGFSIGQTFLDLLTGISFVGMGASTIRFIPDFLVRKKFGNVKTVISNMIIVIILSTGVLTVVSFFAAPFIASNVFHNYWLTPLLQLLVLTFPVLSFFAIFGFILNGFQRFGLSMIMRVMDISIYFFFAIIFLGLGLGIVGVIYAFAIGFAFSGLFGFVVSLREIRKKVKSDKGFKIFDYGLFKEMFNFGKWDYGMAFINLGFTRFNELLIGVFLTIATLGIYAISQTYASVLGYIGMALATTLNPYLSELTAIKMKKRVVNLMKVTTGYSIILSLLLSAPLIVLSYQIFEQFFTQDFLLGATPAKIIIVGFVVSNISGPVGSYFFARKKLWVNFSILLVSLLTGVGLSFILIPVFSMQGLSQTMGMIGAAIALVVGWIVNTVLYAFFTKRYFNINILEKKSAISASLFVVVLLVLALLSNINFQLSILVLIIFEVAVVFVYRRELQSIAKTAEAYLLPPQKKITSK